MLTVLVGGQSRKAGKTTVICEIIRHIPEARWVAVKVSPHKHEKVQGQQPDTFRYLEAGAAAAHLVGKDDPLPEGGNRIIESNAALSRAKADLIIFVANPTPGAEWKPSAHALRNVADVVVTGSTTPELLSRVRQLLDTAAG